MGSGGGVVAVSTYMGGTRGSGVLASAGDVLEMSVGRGVCVWLEVGWEVLEVSGWTAWARVWEGGVLLCLCVLGVWIFCVDGRSRYLYIVLGGFLRILGAPSIQSCCTLSISAS